MNLLIFISILFLSVSISRADYFIRNIIQWTCKNACCDNVPLNTTFTSHSNTLATTQLSPDSSNISFSSSDLDISMFCYVCGSKLELNYFLSESLYYTEKTNTTENISIRLVAFYFCAEGWTGDTCSDHSFDEFRDPLVAMAIVAGLALFATLAVIIVACHIETKRKKLQSEVQLIQKLGRSDQEVQRGYVGNPTLHHDQSMRNHAETSFNRESVDYFDAEPVPSNDNQQPPPVQPVFRTNNEIQTVRAESLNVPSGIERGDFSYVPTGTLPVSFGKKNKKKPIPPKKDFRFRNSVDATDYEEVGFE